MGNMNCTKKSKKNSLPLHIYRYKEQTYYPSSLSHLKSKGKIHLLFVNTRIYI
jgi:hypothetical protein